MVFESIVGSLQTFHNALDLSSLWISWLLWNVPLRVTSPSISSIIYCFLLALKVIYKGILLDICQLCKLVLNLFVLTSQLLRY